MKLSIGDRVRINPEAFDRWGGPELEKQQRAHPGYGYVKDFAGSEDWVWVEFADGYYQNYPCWALCMEQDPVMKPEMDLDEIEKAQEIYNALR